MRWVDPLGLRIEWNDYILSNLRVVRNLIRLNEEIIKLGKKDDEFVLSVSAGDRFIDSQGNVRSITTYYFGDGSQLMLLLQLVTYQLLVIS